MTVVIVKVEQWNVGNGGLSAESIGLEMKQ
jgi:hypothetical protein